MSPVFANAELASLVNIYCAEAWRCWVGGISETIEWCGYESYQIDRGKEIWFF